MTLAQKLDLAKRIARLERIVAALQAVSRCQTDHDLNLALQQLREANQL